MSCLSKSEMEAVGSANGVLPRQTGKATRAALIERLKNEAYVYPPARFALSEGESQALADRVKSAGRFAHSPGDDGDVDDQAETDLDTPPWDEPEAEAA